MNFTPTSEQQAIIDAACKPGPSIMVSAKAGCTKTSTLKMLAQAMKPTPTLALAFNKKNAQDLEKELPSWMTVKTLNGLGHGALMKGLPGKRISLVDRKIGKIVSELFKQEKFEAAEDEWAEVRDWIDAARRAGIVHGSFYPKFKGLLEDTPENWVALSDQPEPSHTLYEFAREGLRRAIAQTLEGNIDFDDQIYGSVCLGGVFPKFSLLIGDEVQDWSPLNREMVKRCVTANGRFILVGDPKQAIYGFRGADTRSMERLRELRSEWIDLELNITFRCPKIVVARQQNHVPGFRAASSNHEGKEVLWHRPKDGKISWQGELHDSWSIAWLKGMKESSGDRIYIVCRNNAPLLSLAFKLIRQGVGPTMLGRDIGAGLVRLAGKISDGKDSMPIPQLISKINEWKENESEKARIMDREHLISGIEDRAECLLATLDNPGVQCAGDLERVLKNLFSREHGDVVLSTGHRVKGLEAEIVLHLDPWRIPSKYAQHNIAQMEQEKNLLYVMETRTKRVFVEASLGDFQ